MPINWNDAKISPGEYSGNDVASAPDTLEGTAAENKAVFDRLSKNLLVPRHNALADGAAALDADVYRKAQVDAAIDAKVVEIGAGDMAKAVYDADGDGVVDDAGKLGGELPAHYATAAALAGVQAATMPRAGGAFTGAVAAVSTPRAAAGLRNAEVRATDAAGDLQTTDRLIFVRK